MQVNPDRPVRRICSSDQLDGPQRPVGCHRRRL